MLKKGSKIYSIIQFKCPRCHNSDLYPTKLTSFQKTFTMKSGCECCGQIYELEPGFYWGSMYIAYGLSSGIMLFGFALVYFLFDLGIFTSFLIVGAILMLCYGLVFRLARAIWINLYVSYSEKADKQPELYKAEHS